MEAPTDDFKWFGEGFDGFPKRLPQDCVEYILHIIDSKIKDDAGIRARLKEVHNAATDLTKTVLHDYIWQRESFNLELQRKDGLDYLRGRTNYGDSVEDEWLIVYLLRELSKQFSDLWTKVVDTDGEFLLIEAANALPRWLNPEIADNRVWIHEGQIMIIPLQQSSSSTAKTTPVSRPLSPKEARTFITNDVSKLIHSPLMEAEAFYRLRNYPEKISDSSYHALVTIPRNLAYILHEKPEHISPAVEAFYLRDPIALRPLQEKTNAGLIFAPKDLVTVSVQFTKVGYAQLKSQQFSAPTVWTPALPKSTERKEYNRTEMGMKVSCGFEMLVADPQNQDKTSVREMKLLLDDINSGEEQLPSDEDVSNWGKREDDESWLDINFEDFESELAGKKGNKGGEGPATANGGFGDKTAQQDLRKMVERFEQFLNDDSAGAEGAELLDDMDFDDDDDDDDDSEISSNGEDKEVSFDEKEFTRMMREMMGMPEAEEEEEEAAEDDPSAKAPPPPKITSHIEKLDSGASPSEEDEDEEGEEIRKVMQRIETELNEAGALNLDPTPQKIAATRNALKGKQKASSGAENDSEEDGEEDVDIDFNLAKNLLESFKGQAGMAGPGGNLLGMMGMQLPRDEDDSKT
ncbi:MAG: hypothetical protein M1827_000145 [Pycnora praestabilis]|nr:MAG: hypothetical protein M1827_000145 [Pycnora praestabilis]